MWVHDEVRTDSALTEGKVLLRHDVAHHTFLPMPAAELVTQLWPPSMPDQHLKCKDLLRIAAVLMQMRSARRSKGELTDSPTLTD